jgi:peptidoglycan/LPS O-acetylase OafA/YrhL
LEKCETARIENDNQNRSGDVILSGKSGYFAGIDGLRAIAVSSVIIFHADNTLIPGGYLGVDIFFVISGFLITRILVLELQEGTFSYWNFYQRRARRLLPALTVVCILSILPSWYLLPPDQLKDFFQSLAAVALFSANFLF